MYLDTVLHYFVDHYFSNLTVGKCQEVTYRWVTPIELLTPKNTFEVTEVMTPALFKWKKIENASSLRS